MLAPARPAVYEMLLRRRPDRDDIAIEALDAARTSLADGIFGSMVSSPLT